MLEDHPKQCASHLVQNKHHNQDLSQKYAYKCIPRYKLKTHILDECRLTKIRDDVMDWKREY